MTLTNTYNTYDIYFGIDVDKKNYSFTVFDKFNMITSKKIPADPENLMNYINNNYTDKKVLCAYESGPTGYSLYDYLNSMNIDCWMISPASVPKPKNSRVKNNRIDSSEIAHHLRAGSLKPVRVPQKEYRELRHFVNARAIYVQNRKASRQRIKGLLLFDNLYIHINIPTSKWNGKFIKVLKELPCSVAVRERLDMLLKDLEYAKSQLLYIHKVIKNFIKNNEKIKKNMEYLQSIPGIGFITAINILGKIGDPKNLQNEREIGSFVGLTPKENSTGDKENRGSISRLGDKDLRSLLIEASWIAIRKDKQLDQFFHRIHSRNHLRIASKIAIVAVARKLTQRIYRVLKSQRKYMIY